MDTSDSKTQTLYDADFYTWTQEQAGLLRAGRLDRADVANIVEEIETLGRSELAALRSSYRLIASHLLKMIHQPSRRSDSWSDTIVRERNNVDDLLEDNPGLRPKRAEALARAYPAARREAANETKLPIRTFPAANPFTLAMIEDHDFWPEVGHDHGLKSG